jgi:hypothetical protein
MVLCFLLSFTMQRSYVRYKAVLQEIEYKNCYLFAVKNCSIFAKI